VVICNFELYSCLRVRVLLTVLKAISVALLLYLFTNCGSVFCSQMFLVSDINGVLCVMVVVYICDVW